MRQIAHKLKMKTPDLMRLNPDVVGEPRTNSFIVVPERRLVAFKKNNPITEEKKDSVAQIDIIDEKALELEKLKEQFEIYEIKKGDTFFNIKKRFGVSRGELLLLNPELKEGLKLGMILKLREKEIERFNVDDEEYYTDYIDYDKNLKIALLLPFKANKYQADTLTLKEIFVQNARLLNITTDFYLGTELAIDSLRNKGVSVDLNVFDTGSRNSANLTRIIAEGDLNSFDAVIGPLYSSEVPTVASNVSAPIVFPVYSKNQSSFAYSNIVKTSPDKKVFREQLEEYIIENFKKVETDSLPNNYIIQDTISSYNSIGGNIIIVSDETYKSIQTSTLIQSKLQFGTDALVNVITPEGGYIAKERFLALLKPNEKNWVVIATNNQVIASDAINSLISLPEETTARVFTFDKGTIYDKVDNLKLAQLEFTYVSDEFVDETSFEVQSFNSQFKRKNKTLPSYYATKGFDITYDILIRLASGKQLEETLNEGISKRIVSKFDYRGSSTMAENKGVFIIKFNKDLTLTKLK